MEAVQTADTLGKTSRDCHDKLILRQKYNLYFLLGCWLCDG